MTWANADFERARAHADRYSRTQLSFARRVFPGILAAAASAGVIVGDGWRGGTPWNAFIEFGAALLVSRIGVFIPNGVLAITGLIAHTFWFVVWGVCFTAVARTLRGGKLYIAAIILTATVWILARVVLPRALGAAELSLMSSAHAVLYLAAIAGALAIGTRIARYA